MYKVLIADDEKVIADGIASALSDIPRLEITAICKNGQEALEVAQNHNFDIIIIDVLMPFCNGLEFLQKYSAMGNESRIIIISGHNDFKYTQEAIRLGVSDYLLKPVNKSLLIEKVNREILLLDKFQIQKSAMLQPLWISGVFNISEAIASLEEFELGKTRLSSKANNDIGFQVFVIAPIKQLGYTLEENVSEELVEAGLRATLSDCGYDNMVIFWKYGLCVTIAISDFNRAIPLYDLNSRFENVLPFSKYRLGCSDASSSCADINILYQNALYALIDSLRDNSEGLRLRQPTGQMSFSVFLRNALIFKDTFCKLLIAKDHDGLKHTIAQIINFLEMSKVDSKYILEYINILISDTFFLLKTNQERPPPFEEIVCQCGEVKKFSDIQELLKKYALSNGDSANIQPTYGSLINRILHFLDNNYHSELSIKIISDKFFLSESHFCKLFKSKVGQTFTEYLTNLRISSACAMLKTTDLRIYEISEKSGFKSPKYFAEVFKGIVGLSPSEYKDL